MSYTLDGTDLTVYGITPGRKIGGNVALGGGFDLPQRIGKTYHSWGDESGIEAYTESSEIFFAGRDITFRGVLTGSYSECRTNLTSFVEACDSVTGTRTFSTPYGDFVGYVKRVTPTHFNGGTIIDMIFREPVADLSGGSLPVTGTGGSIIDNIPFTSFGVYLAENDEVSSLPERKPFSVTKHGAEGYNFSYRENKDLTLRGTIMATDLDDFKSKIKALYLLFSSSGTRQVKLNDTEYVTCFADKGFEVSNIICTSQVLASWRIQLKVTAYSLTGF